MGDYPIELILAALLAISELLALSPLKSNSIFLLVKNILSSLVVKKDEIEDKKDE